MLILFSFFIIAVTYCLGESDTTTSINIETFTNLNHNMQFTTGGSKRANILPLFLLFVLNGIMFYLLEFQL